MVTKKDKTRVGFSTSIDPELKKKFKVYCALNDLNQNDVIEMLIREYLDKHYKEGGGGINGNTDK